MLAAPHANNPHRGAIVWLSTVDAARLLGVTTRTLYRFVYEGDLRAYRFGRALGIKRSDAENFIESCRVRPGELAHLYHLENPS